LIDQGVASGVGDVARNLGVGRGGDRRESDGSSSAFFIVVDSLSWMRRNGAPDPKSPREAGLKGPGGWRS
jgi:hypothetical protein